MQMKLVVQVPCLNEEKTLPSVLSTIPKKIPGIDEIIILIIDDGCSDKTVEVARSLGVKEFVHHARPRGLSRSFQDGTTRALQLGADIIVNTDGDNQYPQEMIPELIKPVLEGRADIVVGDRQTSTIRHFSPVKKLLQRVGSRMVNIAAGTNIPDAASGFRAYSREAILELNLTTTFSYCMEMIIQAGNKRLAITSVPIKTNPKTRESRLFKSTHEHVYKSSLAIIRGFIMYKPYVIFVSLGTTLLVLGAVPFLRYMYFAAQHEPGSHLQSLLLGAVLLVGAFLSYVLGVLADLVRVNRILIEQNLEHSKKTRFGEKPNRRL
jgi:glycosyltransferase involved in cell wall biosynthesis